MGAWGTGPFENDAALDFVGEFDDAAPADRPELIREVLEKALAERDYLDADEGSAAVAAVAVVAAARPGGPALDPVSGPKQPLPRLPSDLLTIAARALERVLGADSELGELWEEEQREHPLWREQVSALRKALS
ncbi:DUF4259 domain-containing protein [Amycolatopsis rhizosphaerae]|uniref:DUF4259 domain-containing protein n=1 Tax=Amycolatopsis rhizosphaerae TaxID=2053003 RepID=A0A558CGN3_9PSEU|nr:DUF4259 domain-containing protein [Amycolatopsis rhizosphaerae]TVT47930.1 DUF4259 domain-containing protein [Amycolatopsis rhizosphaerae]